MPEIASFQFTQLERSTVLSSPADALSTAWAEAEQVREQARRDGEVTGYEEGIARAQQQTAPLADALRQAVTELEQRSGELADRLTADAAQLAVAIAEQILSAELALRPEHVADVARGALRRIVDRQRVVVLVNPDDLELLSGQVDRIQAELGGIEHLDVQADRRLTRGGAVARTDVGEIDASIDAQLETVRELVAASLRGEDTTQ